MAWHINVSDAIINVNCVTQCTFGVSIHYTGQPVSYNENDLAPKSDRMLDERETLLYIIHTCIRTLSIE